MGEGKRDLSKSWPIFSFPFQFSFVILCLFFFIFSFLFFFSFLFASLFPFSSSLSQISKSLMCRNMNDDTKVTPKIKYIPQPSFEGDTEV